MNHPVHLYLYDLTKGNFKELYERLFHTIYSGLAKKYSLALAGIHVEAIWLHQSDSCIYTDWFSLCVSVGIQAWLLLALKRILDKEFLNVIL
jgi:hypothetical protein